MYMYIFSYSHNFRQNSCGFNFVIKLEKFSTIFGTTMVCGHDSINRDYICVVLPHVMSSWNQNKSHAIGYN